MLLIWTRNRFINLWPELLISDPVSWSPGLGSTNLTCLKLFAGLRWPMLFNLVLEPWTEDRDPFPDLEVVWPWISVPLVAGPRVLSFGLPSCVVFGKKKEPKKKSVQRCMAFGPRSSGWVRKCLRIMLTHPCCAFRIYDPHA